MSEEHPAAFAYDWRTRFHLPFPSMDWVEVTRLVFILLQDPTSEVHRAEAKWRFTASRNDLLLMELFDLVHQALDKDWKKSVLIRPDEDPNAGKPKFTITAEQSKALLAEMKTVKTVDPETPTH